MSPNNPPSQPMFEESGQSSLSLNQALHESEERFRATFEQAAVGIAHVAPDGRWLRVNQRLCNILGYTSAEMLATTFQAITHPDDLSIDLEYVRQMLSGERQTYSMEKRYLHKSGEVVWSMLTVSLVHQVSGEPKYFISVIQDIRDRKRVEASLKESELRFRRAIVNAPFPIAIYAENGEILHLSEGWTRLTGYTLEDIPTLDVWVQKAYGAERKTILQSIQQLFEQDHATDEGEFTIQTKDGRRRIWQFSSSPLGQTAAGQRLVMSIASDVTDLKAAESVLAQKLKQQATIAKLGQRALEKKELTPLFNQVTHLAAEALGVEYCKILELSADRNYLTLVAGVGWQPELVGQAKVENNLRSQAGYTLQSKYPVVVENLQTETRFSGPALLLKHSVISGISVVVYRQDTEIFGVLGIHTRQLRQFTAADVDFVQAIANILSNAIEQHEFEQKIQRLNRDLERRVTQRTAQLEAVNEELKAFTYTVSHDLRAPLRAMQGFAQALLEDYTLHLDELGKEYADRIVQSAAQMDGLILDLLEYSRLGRSDIYLQHLNLNQIMDQALQNLVPVIQEYQAEITIEAPLPNIRGNHHIVLQIFNNLLTNGIKFVAADTIPKLYIHWEDKNDKIRLWVEDNGIGIAPEHQQRIFNVFERLHGIESYAGTGIGLAIVKRGIEKLGGTTGVDSAVGQGSRFWVEFIKS